MRLDTFSRAAALALGLSIAGTAHADASRIMHAVGPQGALEGTYLTPATDTAPVVLIVPGSGLIDRDGNSPHGLHTDMYKLLAEDLARQGIASVRVDKRGMFGSARAIADANDVTIAAYADDVRTWIATIAGTTGATCVWLLGHSEGGLVVLHAAQSPERICGLLLVATPGRPPGTLLREQLRANPANAAVLNPALAAIDALETDLRVDPATLPAALRTLFRANVQGFLIDLFGLEPAQLARVYAGPALVLQGERDLQVRPVDAERLAAALPDGEHVVLRQMNHVLKAVPANDITANFGAYTDPTLPLAPGLVEAMVRFIFAHTTR